MPDQLRTALLHAVDRLPESKRLEVLPLLFYEDAPEDKWKALALALESVAPGIIANTLSGLKQSGIIGETDA